jgi:hypothetical protein
MTARRIRSPSGDSGEHDAALLGSTLTRAVLQRNDHRDRIRQPLAFGAARHREHGKAEALSLACTLAAAVLFQPALMGLPRGSASRASRARRDIDANAGTVSASQITIAGGLDIEDALDRKSNDSSCSVQVIPFLAFDICRLQKELTVGAQSV